MSKNKFLKLYSKYQVDIEMTENDKPTGGVKRTYDYVFGAEKKANEDFQRAVLAELKSLKESVGNCKNELTAVRANLNTLKTRVESHYLLEKDHPIREAIVGEWKMVSYENFRACRALFTMTFEQFAANVEFKMDGGRLIQMRAAEILKEGVVDDASDQLFIEKNHLKSTFSQNSSSDRYIEDGLLHYINSANGHVFKRVYKKV